MKKFVIAIVLVALAYLPAVAEDESQNMLSVRQATPYGGAVYVEYVNRMTGQTFERHVSMTPVHDDPVIDVKVYCSGTSIIEGDFLIDSDQKFAVVLLRKQGEDRARIFSFQYDHYFRGGTLSYHRTDGVQQYLMNATTVEVRC